MLRVITDAWPIRSANKRKDDGKQGILVLKVSQPLPCTFRSNDCLQLLLKNAKTSLCQCLRYGKF
jgi:hypothetical protein